MTERNLSDASTTRAQRIEILCQQYLILQMMVKAARFDPELQAAAVGARCILRAQYPQDNANRTEPTYPWSINEGGTT